MSAQSERFSSESLLSVSEVSGTVPGGSNELTKSLFRAPN